MSGSVSFCEASRVFRAVLFMHEGTSSQAGMESRCRHIMGDMERKAKMLWDSLSSAGRLSEQSPSREGWVCFLSVGSPARWSAKEGEVGTGNGSQEKRD